MVKVLRARRDLSYQIALTNSVRPNGPGLDLKYLLTALLK